MRRGPLEMRLRPIVLVFAALAASAPAQAQPSKSTETRALPVLPIHVAVVEEGGKPVRDNTWIDAQLEASNRLFGAFGVRFRVTATRALAERFARLESRQDRDDLARELDPGVVNVFVVASLRDVDDPSRLRMGVH